MVKIDFGIGVGIAGIVLAIVLVVLDKAGKLKGPMLPILLAVAAVMTLPLAFGTTWVSNAPPGLPKSSRSILAVFAVGFAYSLIAVWISGSGTETTQQQREPEGLPVQEPKPVAAPEQSTVGSVSPTLLFVFGAPLGDNDSAQWIMMLKHYGPGPAYNCDVIFYDDDRKNIEHEWLVKHPESPYPPPGLAGESQKRMYIPEAGPEGSAGSFNWNPVDPNSQHYTVAISCRDGVFLEKWEVTRVNGILRSAITIERGSQWMQKNPGKESVVFRYQDPEFVRTSLATEMPKVRKGKVVHPGWKPQHRFEVPAAIIDPNGNIQVVSGIKLPDGSTLTDFGSWNILTRHFGDTRGSSEQP
jgi:hypothetical protein